MTLTLNKLDKIAKFLRPCGSHSAKKLSILPKCPQEPFSSDVQEKLKLLTLFPLSRSSCGVFCIEMAEFYYFVNALQQLDRFIKSRTAILRKSSCILTKSSL